MQRLFFEKTFAPFLVKSSSTPIFCHINTINKIIYRNTISYLLFTKLYCIFALLIEKDGGIRPCEVLATCANKVLHSILIKKYQKKISESLLHHPTFQNKPLKYQDLSIKNQDLIVFFSNSYYLILAT